MRGNKNLLIFSLVLSFILVGIIGVSVMQTPKIITYQINYWNFYSPYSDIYIEKMAPSGNGSMVYFYPDGNMIFSFVTDETIRKEMGKYFVECTRSGNGRYITITDTNIPFLPKTNPFIWGTPIGNNDDFETMKYLFETPRGGDCGSQVDFMVRLAQDRNIITRRINLWQSPINGILTAGGHTTMEVYDRKTKQWIWMDPLFNITEGKIGSKRITLYDLQLAVNRGENIALMIDEKEIQFNQWQHAKIWKNYLNPSQTITYVTPEAYLP